LPCLGACEEFADLIFTDNRQKSRYVFKIPKVHDLNHNPFRAFDSLVRPHPPKIFGGKGFEENVFRICHTGTPK